MNAQEILQEATNSSFAIWFLIGAGLVFFMQAGLQWLKQVLQEQRMQATLL